jgi:KaiC/GvpD/RAD55 family RecA-like ATPase
MRVSELKVLALLRYGENFKKYAGLLKQDFFSIAETKEVFRFIGTYHAKYDGVVDKIPLSYLRIQAEDIKEEGRRNLCQEIIDQLVIKKRTDEFVEDIIRKFGQRSILKQAVIDTFDMLQGKEDTLDLDKIRLKVEQAMEIVVPRQSQVSFFDDAVVQIEYSENEPRVPTGIVEIDEHTRGGVPKKRLVIVVAPAKRGKTVVLVNAGAGAVRRGKKVLHITLEISKAETTIRYAECFLNRPFLYLKNNPDIVRAAMKKIRSRGGELFIEECIGISPTLEQIEALIRSYGIKFDLVIVDYLDLCSTKTQYKDERSPSKEIYTGFRRMAAKMDFVAWSASQSNRQSFDKKIVSMVDVAEDIRKIAICDLGIFVCQTPEEKEDGLMRLFLGATRFSSRNPIFTVSCDTDCMRIQSIVRGAKR